jgi:hypothetical protein
LYQALVRAIRVAYHHPRPCSHTAAGAASLDTPGKTPFGVRSMRKMLMALMVMFLMAGLVVAASGVATGVKGKKVTIKQGDKETEYTVNDSTAYKTTDFKGENAKESTLAALEKASMRKNKKGDVTGVKVEFEADGTTLKSVTWKAGGKKKKQ